MDSIHEHANLNVIKYLIGNKCDMQDSRVVSIEEGQQIAEKYGMKFFETFAKENINLKDVIESIGKEIVDKKETQAT